MSAYITLVNATLGTDIEPGSTQGGTDTAKFRVAVNDRKGGNEVTSWYSVEAYGGTARGIVTLSNMGHLGKGKRVGISGTLTTREYTDKNGVTRTSLDVTANAVEPVWEPRDQQGQPQQPQNNMAESPF
jgi:single-strand DNA-binding protein